MTEIVEIFKQHTLEESCCSACAKKAKSRQSRSESAPMSTSVILEMYRLLGEAPLTKPEVHGAVNKPAKKTVSPKVSPPNVHGSSAKPNKKPGPFATPKNKTMTKKSKLGPSK